MLKRLLKLLIAIPGYILLLGLMLIVLFIISPIIYVLYGHSADDTIDILIGPIVDSFLNW